MNNLCKDCAHFVKAATHYHRCYRDAYDPPDLVMGGPNERRIYDCELERSGASGAYSLVPCGREGKHFIPAPEVKGLIERFFSRSKP